MSVCGSDTGTCRFQGLHRSPATQMPRRQTPANAPLRFDPFELHQGKEESRLRGQAAVDGSCGICSLKGVGRGSRVRCRDDSRFGRVLVGRAGLFPPTFPNLPADGGIRGNRWGKRFPCFHLHPTLLRWGSGRDEEKQPACQPSASKRFATISRCRASGCATQRAADPGIAPPSSFANPSESL